MQGIIHSSFSYIGTISLNDSHSAVKTAYESESELVDTFLCILSDRQEEFNLTGLATEFEYQRGRTDIVCVTHDGDVVAFEAKLFRWKDALNQAYRNTCFAHLSYVVLPYKAAMLASNYEREFSRRKIGLYTIAEGQLVQVIECKRNVPISAWLSDQAREQSLQGFGNGRRRAVRQGCGTSL